MPARDPTNLLLSIGMAAVALMVFVAAKGSGGLIVVPVTVFCVMLVVAMTAVNAVDWNGAGTAVDADRRRMALIRNSRMLGAAYAFCALAMMLLYTPRVTGLRWQHGWQYASAFSLLGILAFEYARMLAKPANERWVWLEEVAVPLAIGQSVFAAGGLAYLTLSGKILARRPDWAANVVFAAGAFMVMVGCAITLRTHLRLSGRDG